MGRSVQREDGTGELEQWRAGRTYQLQGAGGGAEVAGGIQITSTRAEHSTSDRFNDGDGVSAQRGWQGTSSYGDSEEDMGAVFGDRLPDRGNQIRTLKREHGGPAISNVGRAWLENQRRLLPKDSREVGNTNGGFDGVGRGQQSESVLHGILDTSVFGGQRIGAYVGEGGRLLGGTTVRDHTADLEKIVRSGIRATIVVLDWPSQLWQPILRRITVDALVLGQSKTVVEEGTCRGKIPEPWKGDWTMLAVRVDGTNTSTSHSSEGRADGAVPRKLPRASRGGSTDESSSYADAAVAGGQ
ncbi:hypothetical protein PROFUN_13896 [Planoprotostelium fungivorum]|uniref:Uncharacterized protein n=1 Tax=Planoprotostelium fungivorum TaxID=1890364 RepID=A0A2P6N2A4_9EUKA|nr:hypothetical protein PROFUN_13896 [Planoprotostelium fungivorum]